MRKEGERLQEIYRIISLIYFRTQAKLPIQYLFLR